MPWTCKQSETVCSLLDFSAPNTVLGYMLMVLTQQSCSMVQFLVWMHDSLATPTTYQVRIERSRRGGLFKEV